MAAEGAFSDQEPDAEGQVGAGQGKAEAQNAACGGKGPGKAGEGKAEGQGAGQGKAEGQVGPRSRVCIDPWSRVCGSAGNPRVCGVGPGTIQGTRVCVRGPRSRVRGFQFIARVRCIQGPRSRVRVFQFIAMVRCAQGPWSRVRGFQFIKRSGHFGDEH